MTSIQTINNEGHTLTLPDRLLRLFENCTSQEEFIPAIRAAHLEYPEATEGQWIAVAALFMSPAPDLAFAKKHNLVLTIDQQGLVHWVLPSSFHSVPYHFVWVGNHDGSDNADWLMLEGATLRPGDIRVASIEIAHAIASMCEARVIDVRLNHQNSTPPLRWPTLHIQHLRT